MPADAQLLMLDKNQIEPLLQPDDVLNAVKEAFTLHSQKQGRIFPVVRELPDGFLKHVKLFVDDRIQAAQIGETQWAPDTPPYRTGRITR